MEKLTELEKGVIVLRLGLDDLGCRTHQDIARITNLSVWAVRKAEIMALIKTAKRLDKDLDEVKELYRQNRKACEDKIASPIDIFKEDEDE